MPGVNGKCGRCARPAAVEVIVGVVTGSGKTTVLDAARADDRASPLAGNRGLGSLQGVAGDQTLSYRSRSYSYQRRRR